MRTDRTSSHADELITNVQIPDTQLVREITEFVRDTETELLFNHSSRVYFYAPTVQKTRYRT